MIQRLDKDSLVGEELECMMFSPRQSSKGRCTVLPAGSRGAVVENLQHLQHKLRSWKKTHTTEPLGVPLRAQPRVQTREEHRISPRPIAGSRQQGGQLVSNTPRVAIVRKNRGPHGCEPILSRGRRTLKSPPRPSRQPVNRTKKRTYLRRRITRYNSLAHGRVGASRKRGKKRV